MFEGIKKKIFKIFNNIHRDEKENEIIIPLVPKEDVAIFIKKKTIDPTEKQRKKFQIIAKRTKSWRIRDKNIKRLIETYE